MAYMMDFFAANNEEKVLAAIRNAVVQYPAYVFIRNTDGKTGRLGFVDQNNVLKYIVGEENKKQVINVSTLPDISEADIEVLYICEGNVYMFDGTDYKSLGTDHTAELQMLTEKVATLEKKVTNLENSNGGSTDTSELEARIETLEASNATLVEQLDGVTKTLTGIEERVVEIETGNTFVELE